MANKGGGKPSDRRAGKRRDRNQRVGIRVPELGYYLIVTDTEETEKNYFEGLRDSILDDIIQTAEKSGVGVGWSNPCFEIWMYAYFGEMPVIQASYTCCDRFADKFEKVTGQKYFKKDKDIYRKLVRYGNEGKAIQIAERCYKKCIDVGKEKPSEMWLACMVQRLVEEIRKKQFYDDVVKPYSLDLTGEYVTGIQLTVG